MSHLRNVFDTSRHRRNVSNLMRTCQPLYSISLPYILKYSLTTSPTRIRSSIPSFSCLRPCPHHLKHHFASTWNIETCREALVVALRGVRLRKPQFNGSIILLPIDVDVDARESDNKKDRISRDELSIIDSIYMRVKFDSNSTLLTQSLVHSSLIASQNDSDAGR